MLFDRQLTELRRLMKNKNRYNKRTTITNKKTLFDYVTKSSMFKPSKSLKNKFKNKKSLTRATTRDFYKNYKTLAMKNYTVQMRLRQAGYREDVFGNFNITGKELYTLLNNGKEYTISDNDLNRFKTDLYYKSTKGQDVKLLINYINFENELIKNFGDQGYEYAKYLQTRIAKLKVGQRRKFMESLSSGRFGITITSLYKIGGDIMLEETEKIEQVQAQVENTIQRILEA